MPKKKTSKIRQSARGEQCTVRIPGVCNWNPETTVLAHLNGGGMGTKNPDYQGAYACSMCHDVIDGRQSYGHHECLNDNEARLLVELYHMHGVIRTQEILREKGLIVVK